MNRKLAESVLVLYVDRWHHAQSDEPLFVRFDQDPDITRELTGVLHFHVDDEVGGVLIAVHAGTGMIIVHFFVRLANIDGQFLIRRRHIPQDAHPYREP